MYKGYFLIIAAASCWGLIGIFSSVAFAHGVQPMEVAFWRAILAWLLFGSYALVRQEVQLHRKDIPLLVLFGILGISVFYVSYLIAVKEGGAAFAAVLLYTAPAWVVVCSFFIYRETLTIYKIVSVMMVIGGVMLISRVGDTSASRTGFGFIAVSAGLISGFSYSLYYTIGKYFSSRYSPANLFFYILPVGALGIYPFVEFHHKTASVWLAMAAVAFFSTFIANYCYYQGLKYLEAGRASIVATVEPVVAALFAYLILNESFTLYGYLGAVVILSAVLITIVKS